MRRTVSSLLAVLVVTTAGAASLPAVAADHSSRSAGSKTYVSALDRSGDVRRVERVKTKASPKVRNSIDLRRVTVEQLDDRTARFEIVLARLLPRTSRWAQSVSVLMRPVNFRKHPFVVVSISQNKRVRSFAETSFSDGSHTHCDLRVIRDKAVGSMSVDVPERCAWWSSDEIDVRTGVALIPKGFKPAIGYLYDFAYDTRTLYPSPPLAWTYDDPRRPVG